MNPRPPSDDPDRVRPEWLAGYADGELGPAARDRVERWLADHPEARDTLGRQRELSRVNRKLWRDAQPPALSPADWDALRERIAAELEARPVAGASTHPTSTSGAGRRPGGEVRARHLLAAVAAAAAAVAVWFASRPPAASTPTPSPPAAGAAAADPFAVATANDVILERVPGDPDHLFPIGDHPLLGTLVLADDGDVELHDYSETGWPDGEPRMTTAPGDAPILYAARPR